MERSIVPSSQGCCEEGSPEQCVTHRRSSINGSSLSLLREQVYIRGLGQGARRRGSMREGGDEEGGRNGGGRVTKPRERPGRTHRKKLNSQTVFQGFSLKVQEIGRGHQWSQLPHSPAHSCQHKKGGCDGASAPQYTWSLVGSLFPVWCMHLEWQAAHSEGSRHRVKREKKAHDLNSKALLN